MFHIVTLVSNACVISVAFSDPSEISKYNGCVNNVVTECPEQASDIESHFSKHLALFCKGNNVSTWLRTGKYYYQHFCLDSVMLTMKKLFVLFNA